MSVRSDAAEGARAIGPFMLGVVPFGLITGISAIDAGFGAVQTVAMSVVIFAGASQLALIELVGDSAPVAVVVVRHPLPDCRRYSCATVRGASPSNTIRAASRRTVSTVSMLLVAASRLSRMAVASACSLRTSATGS